MSTGSTSNWLGFLDAELYLKRRVGGYAGLRAEGIVMAAALSPKVPKRGYRPSNHVLQDIGEIPGDATANLLMSEISDRSGQPIWQRVEMKRAPLDDYAWEYHDFPRPELPSSAGGKKAAGAKPTKRNAVALYIEGNYPNGIPADKSDKVLAKEVETSTGFSVDERTVRRARGRK